MQLSKILSGMTAPALQQALQEALPVGLCLVDGQGRVLSLNPEGARLIEWAEADCLGQSLHELICCRIEPDGPGPSHPGAEPPQETAIAIAAIDRPGPCPIAKVLETGLPAWAPQATIRSRSGWPMTRSTFAALRIT